MKVLVIAAHTDDEVLGVGGTMARHAADGDEVFVCNVCDRATNHEYDRQIIGDLQDACRRATARLGVKDVIFCGGLDERVTVPEAIALIEKPFEQIAPDVVYLHHRGDSNQDHHTVFRAGVVVTRAISRHVANRVLCYHVPSSTEQGAPFADHAFLPNVFVDIAGTLALKLEAMAEYETELKPYPYPRSIEALRVDAQYWGIKAGLTAAEPFELMREIVPGRR